MQTVGNSVLTTFRFLVIFLISLVDVYLTLFSSRLFLHNENVQVPFAQLMILLEGEAEGELANRII